MRALISTPGGQVDAVALQPSTLWAGSDPACALRLRGPGIAPRHLRLDVAEDGRYGIVDLGAPAGTRLNGERVVTAGPLGPQDVVWIGEVELRIVADSNPVAAVEVEPPRAIERQQPPATALVSWPVEAVAVRRPRVEQRHLRVGQQLRGQQPQRQTGRAGPDHRHVAKHRRHTLRSG